MQVTRLDNLSSCRSFATAWDCMAHGVPFRRTAWLWSWWKHYQAEGSLYVLRVTDDQGAVVGIAPWYLDCSVGQGRAVRPLGSGKACSDYLGILATKEHYPQVCTALARWLVGAAAGERSAEDRWDLLDLVSVDPRDTIMDHFVDQLERVGNGVHRRAAPACWRIELPATWDQYPRTLGKSHRKRVRRIDRKWLESGATWLRTADSQEKFDDAMEILMRLHQDRQRSVGYDGAFADSRFTNFLRDAGRQLLRESSLALHWMELDGLPFAAEFQLRSGGAIYAYLGGMSCYMQESSPGQIIQVAILKKAIEEGVRMFDFLRGDETYKAQWGSEPYHCEDVRVVPARQSSQLRHQLWVAGGAMKQLIRSGLHISGAH